MALWQGASFTRGGAHLTCRLGVPRGEHARLGCSARGIGLLERRGSPGMATCYELAYVVFLSAQSPERLVDERTRTS